MRVEILTIFPGIFDQFIEYGMVRQARLKGLLAVSAVDLRKYSTDRHRTVDDRPYGGGEGMVMKPEPIYLAVESLRLQDPSPPHVVLFSAHGSRFDQTKAKELSLKARLVLICGRYEGVDQRVADHLVDEEISAGDFILSGGEIAAALLLDSVSRLIPGVLGEGQSALRESFMEGLLDYPHYTRPAEFRGWKVPEVLLSGNHLKIRQWREKQALKLTQSRRPDLFEALRRDEDECNRRG